MMKGSNNMMTFEHEKTIMLLIILITIVLGNLGAFIMLGERK
jgi:hypothetical protein